MAHNDNIKRRNMNMFQKSKIEIYELDLTDIIVTSDPNANFGDEDDDIVIWPR